MPHAVAPIDFFISWQATTNQQVEKYEAFTTSSLYSKLSSHPIIHSFCVFICRTVDDSIGGRFMDRRSPRGALLTTLPYDILYKILSLVLPTLPARVRLKFDPAPSWLNIFICENTTTACPPILLVCRLLTRHCLRIIYTHARLSIHASRKLLAQLSHLRARRYIQHLDLAIETRLHPSSKVKDEICPRHDIISFYSPAYLVDLLHRMFPRLKSIHLTVVETLGPVVDDHEVTHFFPLSSLTCLNTIDPTTWNSRITSLRYKTDATFTPPNLKSRHPLHTFDRAAADDEATAELHATILRKNILAKFAPLTPTILPNLAHIEFYVTTQQSYFSNFPNRVHSEADVQQLREQFETICGDELFGVEGLEVALFRTVVWANAGQAQGEEMGWERMSHPCLQALFRRRVPGKGKAKVKAKEVELDA
jgi:hypothetical protein